MIFFILHSGSAALPYHVPRQCGVSMSPWALPLLDRDNPRLNGVARAVGRTGSPLNGVCLMTVPRSATYPGLPLSRSPWAAVRVRGSCWNHSPRWCGVCGPAGRGFRWWSGLPRCVRGRGLGPLPFSRTPGRPAQTSGNLPRFLVTLRLLAFFRPAGSLFLHIQTLTQKGGWAGRLGSALDLGQLAARL